MLANGFFPDVKQQSMDQRDLRGDNRVTDEITGDQQSFKPHMPPTSAPPFHRAPGAFPQTRGQWVSKTSLPIKSWFYIDVNERYKGCFC